MIMKTPPKTRGEALQMFADVIGAEYIPGPERDVAIGSPVPRNVIPPAITINAARPASEPEPMKDPWSGRTSNIRLDQFGANVAVKFVRRLLPRSTFTGPEPTMFRAGSLPPLTVSGADSSVLWSVRWDLRHSASMTASRANLLRMSEEGPDEIDPSRLQNRPGQALLREYLSRVRSWAIAGPAPEDLTDGDIQALFPPSPGT